MKPRELSPDALRLLIRIGGCVEQRVLDHARLKSTTPKPIHQSEGLSVQDVRDALEELLQENAAEFRSILIKELSDSRMPRRAG